MSKKMSVISDVISDVMLAAEEEKFREIKIFNIPDKEKILVEFFFHSKTVIITREEL